MLATVVAKKEAYLMGYPQPFAGHTLMTWWTQHEMMERKSIKIQNTSVLQRKCKLNTYMGSIQSQTSFINSRYMLPKFWDITQITTIFKA